MLFGKVDMLVMLLVSIHAHTVHCTCTIISCDYRFHFVVMFDFIRLLILAYLKNGKVTDQTLN